MQNIFTVKQSNYNLRSVVQF